jgi:hypothetical protein
MCAICFDFLCLFCDIGDFSYCNLNGNYEVSFCTAKYPNTGSPKAVAKFPSDWEIPLILLKFNLKFRISPKI